MRCAAALVFAAASLLVPARCGAAGAEQELLVSAAASLTNAFTEAARAFERANPGLRVVLNLAASGTLLQQIGNGAPVDVFASADQETMDQAQKRGLLADGSRTNFARNLLVLAVPASSKLRIAGVQDLVRPDIKRVALGDPSFVPAGRYARQGLVAAGLWDVLAPKRIPGNSVRQVLDYLARGEVDAGFVFATDAAASKGRVVAVAEVGGTGPILYPIAVVAESGKKDLARRFEEFVLSPAAGAILARHGFSRP
ncbi:MAG: molybdate ABC transporter substrate-binding protein [Deltaproteobacteria bacterium]|nr:molybdate ABC transporter substrate-binding protein [Deltaproteobacteria bacterium]